MKTTTTQKRTGRTRLAKARALLPNASKRRAAQNKFSDALHALQAEAKAKGLDKLTMRDINTIIADSRREKDPLYGQTKRISVSISLRMYQELKAAAKDLTGSGELCYVVRQAIGDYLRNEAPRLRKATKQRPSAD